MAQYEIQAKSKARKSREERQTLAGFCYEPSFAGDCVLLFVFAYNIVIEGKEQRKRLLA